MKYTTPPHLHYNNLQTNPYIRLRLAHCLSLLFPHLNHFSSFTILDVGGYTADFYLYLRTAFPTKKISYHVIDHDSDALKIANKRGAIPHLLNLAKDSPQTIFPHQRFDLVICTEVLEHLPDPESLLLALKTLVKKNGLCFISLPNENTFYHRLKVLTGFGLDSLAFQAHKHLHFPTISQSHRFLASQFRILQTRSYFDYGSPESGFFSHLLSLIPSIFWQLLANSFPSLFARGTIFLLKPLS